MIVWDMHEIIAFVVLMIELLGAYLFLKKRERLKTDKFLHYALAALVLICINWMIHRMLYSGVDILESVDVIYQKYFIIPAILSFIHFVVLFRKQFTGMRDRTTIGNKIIWLCTIIAVGCMILFWKSILIDWTIPIDYRRVWITSVVAYVNIVLLGSGAYYYLVRSIQLHNLKQSIFVLEKSCMLSCISGLFILPAIEINLIVSNIQLKYYNVNHLVVETGLLNNSIIWAALSIIFSYAILRTILSRVEKRIKL